MAGGKTLQSTVEIAGVLSPSLQAAIRAAVDRFDDMSKEMLDSAGAAEKLSAEIDTQENVLKKLRKGYADFVVDGKESSDEAKQLADKIDELSGDLKTNKKRLNDAEDAARELGDGFEDAKDESEEMGAAMASFLGNLGADLVGKMGDAVSSVAALPEETREYREDMAKLDAAFTSSGHTVETAQQAYDGFYRILGESDRTVEAVNHLAEMTTSTEDLTKWQTIAAGVTARFGDSLPIEGLTEAANETAKVGKVTGPLADALNWAGISEDKFNEMLAKCTTEQERAALITNTLNSEYSAAAAEYNNLTANTQAARDATNRMEQAQASLGEALEPTTTAWNNMKAGAMEWLVSTGLPALQTGFNWLTENIPTVAGVVATLTTAWLVFGGAQKISNAITIAMTAAQAALNIVMSANPIGLIILAVVGLITAFVALWNNCEGFRNFFIGLWESIKNAVSSAINWIVSAWENIKTMFSNMATRISEGISGAFKSVINGVIGFAERLINGFIGHVNNAIELINKIPGVNIPLIATVNLPKLAAGGFTDGVSIAGEAGTEAVISFDPAYRKKNIGIWEKAGRMLGALSNERQGAGLTSKAGELLTLDDFSLGSLADNGGVVIYYDFSGFTWSPQLQTSGSEDEDGFMAKLKAHEAEFFDWLEEFIHMREEAQYA